MIEKTAGEKFPRPTRFVVFGYSNCVLKALGGLDGPVRQASYVYICECRNKSLYYEMDNSVEYCDGVEYARKIRALGYRNIQIISDASSPWPPGSARATYTSWRREARTGATSTGRASATTTGSPPTSVSGGG
jgi:hypothetical protein